MSSVWRQIDAIYILCHREKESVRWQRLQGHLEARGLPKDLWSFVDLCWADEINESALELYDPFLARPGCPYLSWKGRALSEGEISLVLNFWKAVDDAIEKGHKTILVFESDVFLREDFVERLGDLMKLLETQQWDYVSLSDGVGTHAKRPDLNTDSVYAATGVYKPPHCYPFRCTDSMLFRVDFLKEMRKTAFPFRECLDWELNWQLAIHRGVALWVEPHFVEQGTMKHRMVTSLPS